MLKIRLLSLIAGVTLGLAVPVALAAPSYAAAPSDFTCRTINFTNRMAFADNCSPSYSGTLSDFILISAQESVICGSGNDIGVVIVGKFCQLL